MKDKNNINTGDLIKKKSGHRRAQGAVVVAEGADQYQTVLANWIRIRYLDTGAYEWVKKHGVELITKLK